MVLASLGLNPHPYVDLWTWRVIYKVQQRYRIRNGAVETENLSLSKRRATCVGSPLFTEQGENKFNQQMENIFPQGRHWPVVKKKNKFQIQIRRSS